MRGFSIRRMIGDIYTCTVLVGDWTLAFGCMHIPLFSNHSDMSNIRGSSNKRSFVLFGLGRVPKITQQFTNKHVVVPSAKDPQQERVMCVCIAFPEILDLKIGSLIESFYNLHLCNHRKFSLINELSKQ
ncbi:hypothetical protein VNO80_05478 [Phaseolus coccineus]|uniref:Uncharacterized protein n=1 Tax=Phaseolus coccineus TaxID=3886 RepID=A0AAN9RHW6_PHACN